jgi:DNA (cytosine-5)-methyltransferase 1
LENLSHIELFAGCGGMGLGLKACGFDLLFANELSPMAGETFAYNILKEDLENISTQKGIPQKTLWIKSEFNKLDLKDRLRENPFMAKNGECIDLNETIELKQKLLIGDIDNLLSWLDKHPKIVEKLKNQNITLISGGPPCQSFSLAGRREKNNAKNLLPLSFAKFAGLLKPKFVILENVKGITAPFTENGKKYFAWFEVAKAFVLEGFVPICMLLNSKFFGVAQNRPRFILLALRYDIAKKLFEKRKDASLNEGLHFYSVVNKHLKDLESLSPALLRYPDIESNPSVYNGFLFPKISSPEGQFISAAEAIGDIKKTDGKILYSKSRVAYRDYLNSIFPSPFPKEESTLYNHEPRAHNYDVKARFRLYQIMNEFQNGIKKSATQALLGNSLGKEELTKLAYALAGYEIYIKNGGPSEYYKRLTTPDDVQSYIKSISTKKHSQRALKEYEPAPAQLTIPDDVCHYDMGQLRTLTVREMARFQSFPDWFVFKSKITTGGSNRKFEVPQYTQVGNAVPPLLAKALGDTIINLLKIIKE